MHSEAEFHGRIYKMHSEAEFHGQTTYGNESCSSGSQFVFFRFSDLIASHFADALWPMRVV